MVVKQRCSWVRQPLNQFHDFEWAVPVTTEEELFCLLALQIWQSGLSMTVLLRKRAALCQTFHYFDPQWLRVTNEDTLLAKLDDDRLIRNRRKLFAIWHNAFALQRLHQQHLTLSQLLWQQHKPTAFKVATEIPRYDESGLTVAAQLKQADFQFMGLTNCYALLATAGVLNLHLTSCWRYPIIQEAQSRITTAFASS